MKSSQTFTTLQLEEMHYKLCIVRDDPDVTDSYDATPEELAVATDLLYHATPFDKLFFVESIVDCLIGELENSIEICQHNAEFCADPQAKAEYRGTIVSFRKAIKKLQS